MSDLTAADFDKYFRAVHGHEPYPWQSRLTKEVLANQKWPEVIDLPTGTGKTSVLDTAIFTLATRPEVFPRRVVFVIDRRIVVDQVYERAEKISVAISEASEGVLVDIRDRLNKLSDANKVLGFAALRGGIPLDGEWFKRPEQPWVLVSTVDQFGSRLLFRGYGVSERMRPVHAGLAGNDCLVILDEVHLSRAFAATLREVSSDGLIPDICSVGGGLPRRFEIVEMSATPASENANRFDLLPEDLEASDPLKQIAEAPKRATLVEVPGTRPAHETVPKAVLKLLGKNCDELGDDEMSVGVIVNRVRTAREVHKALQEKGIAAHLVTGRMRPLDKQEVLEKISGYVDPDRSFTMDEPTVVVATQAIEVGADFSFDVLITEAAPSDSLRQRLGRLDRRGKLAASRGDAARCWILGVSSALNPKKPDPIYGDSVRFAWEGLQEFAEDGEVEVGPATNLLNGLGDNAQAPKCEAPLLLPTHVDAWSQTNPKPVVDPPIREFLHGKEREDEPDVSVVWRLDRSESAIILVPPRPAEFLSVPISAVRSWLGDSAEVPVGDLATGSSEDEAKRGQSDDGRLTGVVRWERKTTAIEHVDDVKEIKPGDVIIVDPALGGMRNGTWDPSYRPAERQTSGGSEVEPWTSLDIGDQAQFVYGKRATLRLDQRLFEEPGFPSMPLPAQERDAEKSPRESIREWLSKVRDLASGSVADWLAGVVELLLADNFEFEVVNAAEGADYYVLVQQSVDPAVLDGFEDQPSLTGTETTLREHLSGVGARVAGYGHRLGLSKELIEDLRLAGELHDLGKVDSRFQAQMHGHDPVLLAVSDEPLAKSIRGARTNRDKWPPVRHEFSSVALAQRVPELLDRAHDSDLVLHLVGSHHGFSRPLPTIKKDDDPQPLEVSGEFFDDGFRLVNDNQLQSRQGTRGLVAMSTHSDLAETPLALDMADRFWRLQERYGHHGLAWLEAILRLADQQQSAEEAR